jgi:tetratricopeptide (TPR) repeat protein
MWRDHNLRTVAASPRGMRLARRCAVLGLLALQLCSCAYYNTFYLARKYYFKATDGQPYEVDRDGTGQRPNYNKSSDYAKKLLGVYPKSKWVDDAWLMWARSLIGTDDPLKAIAMLEEFNTRFPKSELRPDAEFFLGLAFRAAHKHDQAVEHFDAFLKLTPKDELAPYAYYERSKALMSLERYQDAPRRRVSALARPRARRPGAAPARRGALPAARLAAARRLRDHRARAPNDDDRFRYPLREVDCPRPAAVRPGEGALERRAPHVAPPPVPDAPRVSTTPGAPGTQPPPVQTYVASCRVHCAAGSRCAWAARSCRPHAAGGGAVQISTTTRAPRCRRAQYRIGFAFETGADDFARARQEYARVKEQGGMSQFSQQAQQRLDNLERIEKYRTASGADSAERKAEANFLVAEHYLFNLERPDRAVQEYQSIFDSSDAPAVKARAMNAQAWVLSRKLGRKESADSLFWKVVREFPATEAQLAARDYLEAEGHPVSESLIKIPPGMVIPVPVAEEPLTQPPPDTPKLGASPAGIEPAAVHYGPGTSPVAGAALGTTAYAGASSLHHAQLPDSVKRVMATRDSVLHIAMSDSSAAGQARVDSLERAYAHADTLGRGAQMAAIQRGLPVATGVVLAPGGGTAPNLAAGAGEGGAVRSQSSTGASAQGASSPLPPAPPSTGRATAAPRRRLRLK